MAARQQRRLIDRARRAGGRRKAGRVGVEATAFPHREASYNLVILGQWGDVAEDPRHIGWARDCWEALDPWASGAVYMNTLGEDAEPQAVRGAYGTNYSRLAALKAQLDPKNLFRMNQNITPLT